MDNEQELNNSKPIEDVKDLNEEPQKQAKTQFKPTYILLIAIFAISIFLTTYIILNSIGSNNISSASTYQSEVKTSNSLIMTDVSDIVEETMPTVVSITSKTTYQQPDIGAGSGVIIGKNDTELLIVTNNHVVSDSDELSVTFIDKKTISAKIKDTDSNNDIAIVAVKLSDIEDSTMDSIKIITLGDSNEVKTGNGVIAIGNALGYGQSKTQFNPTYQNNVGGILLIAIFAIVIFLLWRINRD